LRLTITGSPMNFTFTSSMNLQGHGITATATDVTVGSLNQNDTSPFSTCVTVTPVPGSGAPSTIGTPLAGAVFLAAVAWTAGAGSSPSASADGDPFPAPASPSPAPAVGATIDRSRPPTARDVALAVLSGRARKPAPSAHIAADLVFAQPPKLWLPV